MNTNKEDLLASYDIGENGSVAAMAYFVRLLMGTDKIRIYRIFDVITGIIALACIIALSAFTFVYSVLPDVLVVLKTTSSDDVIIRGSVLMILLISGVAGILYILFKKAVSSASHIKSNSFHGKLSDEAVGHIILIIVYMSLFFLLANLLFNMSWAFLYLFIAIVFLVSLKYFLIWEKMQCYSRMVNIVVNKLADPETMAFIDNAMMMKGEYYDSDLGDVLLKSEGEALLGIVTGDDARYEKAMKRILEDETED